MTEKTEEKWVPACDRCFQTEMKTRLNSAWHTVIVAMFWIFVTSLTGYTIGHELLTKINLHDGQWIFGAILWVTLISTCAFFAFRALWELLVGRPIFTFFDVFGSKHIHPVHPVQEAKAWKERYLPINRPPYLLQTRVGGLFRKSLILIGEIPAVCAWPIERRWNGFMQPEALVLNACAAGLADKSPYHYLQQTLDERKLYEGKPAFLPFVPDSVQIQIKTVAGPPALSNLIERLQATESYILAMIMVIYEAKKRGLNSPHAATIRSGLVEAGHRLFGEGDNSFTRTCAALRQHYDKQTLNPELATALKELLAKLPLSRHSCPHCRYPLFNTGPRHPCVFCGSSHTETSLMELTREKAAAAAAADAVAVFSSDDIP